MMKTLRSMGSRPVLLGHPSQRLVAADGGVGRLPVERVAIGIRVVRVRRLASAARFANIAG